MQFHSQNPDKKYMPASMTFCAQCGEKIYMAAWSEHIDAQRIRHLWECDACDYTFETLVRFPLPRFAQAA
jgi:ribosomal protein S27AE